jgi:hypothetical protein
MADATVYDTKVALCPNCGAQRLFYYEGPSTSNPVPIGSPSFSETDDVIKDTTAFAVLTGWTKKTITDGTAEWTDDEHKGKVVDVQFKEGSDVFESRKIIGNTSDTLTLGKKLRGKHMLPVNSPRPSGLFYDGDPPYYRIRESDRADDGFKDKVKTKRWSNSEFICDGCQTVYTIP